MGPDNVTCRELHAASLATAVAKYWVCKRAPAQVYEALECHGGAGYIEESIMPRLYREAPLAGYLLPKMHFLAFFRIPEEQGFGGFNQ